MEQIKPKNYLNKIFMKSFNKSLSKIVKLNYYLSLKNDFFNFRKTSYLRNNKKKYKDELLISSNFSNLNNLEKIYDLLSLELSRPLQNHNQCTN